MEYGNGNKNQLVWESSANKYHNESFNVTEDNENVNVAILSNYVKPGEKILDIGCGEGKFGKILKKKNCILYGIEIDPAAKKTAMGESQYNDIFVFNIENVNVDNSEYKRFIEKQIQVDSIALIDILEHVLNPTAVILNALKFLNKDGHLLVSVPNVNNADIFLNLMEGNFNYRDAGVLDNTHAKYFTKRSFVQWIDEINTKLQDFSLECEYVGGTFGYTDYLEQVKRENPFTYSFIQLNPYFNVIQHLFVLSIVEKSESKPEKLKSLLKESYGNMLEVLEQSLSNNLSDGGKTKLLQCKLLPNERHILQEQADTAQKGWRECAQCLAEANEGWNHTKEMLEEVSLKWKECAAGLVQANSGWQKSEEELEKTQLKWKECAEGLKQANNNWKKTEAELEKNRLKWEECAESLEAAKQGWKNSDNELNKAHDMLKNYEKDFNEMRAALESKEKDNSLMRSEEKQLFDKISYLENENKVLSDTLNDVKGKWEECAQALAETSKGWSECANALNYLRNKAEEASIIKREPIK